MSLRKAFKQFYQFSSHYVKWMVQMKMGEVISWSRRTWALQEKLIHELSSLSADIHSTNLHAWLSFPNICLFIRFRVCCIFLVSLMNNCFLFGGLDTGMMCPNQSYGAPGCIGTIKWVTFSYSQGTTCSSANKLVGWEMFATAEL